MTPTRRRETIILVVAGVLAVIVPVCASHYLQLRIRSGLEPALERRLGVDVDVGGIDASLTGVVRLRDVSVGDLFSAASVEAAVGLGPLISGELFLDEVRVDQPQLRIVRTASGKTNLQQLLARLRKTRTSKQKPAGSRARSRIGRAVVTGGELVVMLDDGGQIRARDVELLGKPGGVRLITGAVSISARHRHASLAAEFKRAAADISTKTMGARRVLAAGGLIRLTGPNGHVVTLHDASLSRGVLAGTRAVTLRGSVNHVAGASQIDVGLSLRKPASVTLRGRQLPLEALTGLSRPGFDLKRAFADGTIRIGLAERNQARIAIAANIRGVHVNHDRVASVPVDVDGRVELSATVNIAGPDRRLTLERMSLVRNGAELRLSGDLLWRGRRLPAAANLRAELPTVACDKALTALPLAMRDRLVGMKTRGTIGATASLSFDRAHPGAKLAVDVDIDACKVTREPLYADARRLKKRYRYTRPDGRRVRLARGAKGYTTLGPLPRYLLRAFISGEDGRFYKHNGFDPLQIERSLALDLRDARFVRGGSTISQQLVKNLFLTHRRTLARKFQEAVLTWRLEKHLSKRLILERYLNIIELGQGIYGIEAAARHWFDKPARKLRLREAAFLAALTPAPTTISKRIRSAGGIDAATRERINTILRAMRRDRAIKGPDYAHAKKQRLKLKVPELALKP